LAPRCSDSANQEEAVLMVVDLFTNHVKPVIIIGPKVRMFRTRDYRRALVRFAEKVCSILLLKNTRHAHHALVCLLLPVADLNKPWLPRLRIILKKRIALPAGMCLFPN
jgi:hypothetical protein